MLLLPGCPLESSSSKDKFRREQGKDSRCLSDIKGGRPMHEKQAGCWAVASVITAQPCGRALQVIYIFIFKNCWAQGARQRLPCKLCRYNSLSGHSTGWRRVVTWVPLAPVSHNIEGILAEALPYCFWTPPAGLCAGKAQSCRDCILTQHCEGAKGAHTHSMLRVRHPLHEHLWPA